MISIAQNGLSAILLVNLITRDLQIVLEERRFAILIGASEFGQESGVANLRCPPADVDGIYDLLTSRRQARSRERTSSSFLTCLIQRIAAIRKPQLYNALNPRIDPVSRPPCPLDRREFRYVRTVWPPKPAAVRLSRH